MKTVKYIFALATCVLSATSCETAFKQASLNNNIVNNPNTKVTVTFDSNGGVLTGKSVVSVDSGVTFGSVTKPIATLSGVASCGWYTTTPGTYIKDTDVISSSITLKADWKKYTLTFNSGEGKFDEGTTSKTLSNKVIVHGEEVGIPLAPVDKAFDGWEIDSSNAYITFPYKPSGDSLNISLTAKYKTVSTVNVVLMAKEGYFEDNKKSISVKLEKGKTLKQAVEAGLLTYPTRDGDYIFANYALNGVDITDSHAFNNSELLVAKYDNAISVTFDANGGKFTDESSSKSTAKIKYNKTDTLSKFKELINDDPKLEISSVQYDVKGWATDTNSNNPIELSSTLESLSKTGSFTLYAYYKNPHEMKFSGSGFAAPEDKSFIRNETKDFIITPTAGYSLSTDKVAVSYDSTTYTNTIVTKTLLTDKTIKVSVTNAPGADISVSVTPTAIEYVVTDGTSSTEKAKFKSLSIPNKATYNTEVSVTAEGNDGFTPDFILINDSNKVSFILESGTTYKAKFTMTYTADITIAAYSKYINYSVTQGSHDIGVTTDSVKFKIGSGAESSSLSEAHVGDTITVTASNDTGYTLNQIEVTHDSTTDKYSITSGSASYTMPASNCVVKVTATINKHTINLDGNGGTASVTSISNVNYGTLLTTAVSGKTATHDDAAFKGWGLDSTSQDIISTETMPDNDQTLYAIWNKYTFKFFVPTTDPHGSVSGTTEYASKITLSNSDITGLTVTPNEGYKHTGKYKVYVDEETTARMTIDLSTTTLKPGKFDTPVNKDCVIKLEPEFAALSYDVSFTYSEHEHLTSDDPIEITYGTKILEASLPTATHDYAKFNSWKDNDGNTITSETTMPAKALTLKPTWDTYTINVVVENGTSSKTQFSERIELSCDEFSISPSEGYEFNDKYQYSMDGVTYTDLSSTPFRPYTLDSSIVHGQQVYLKAICEAKPAETVDVVLYAGDGSFTGGSDQKLVNVVKNKTWGDIKATAEVIAWTSDLTPPTGMKFDHWSTEFEGSTIEDSFTFDDDVMLFAVYVAA